MNDCYLQVGRCVTKFRHLTPNVPGHRNNKIRKTTFFNAIFPIARLKTLGSLRWHSEVEYINKSFRKVPEAFY